MEPQAEVPIPGEHPLQRFASTLLIALFTLALSTNQAQWEGFPVQP